MRFFDSHRRGPLCLWAALALGCTSPNKQLTQIQQDKEQLLVAIRDQRDKNRLLQGQVVSLESRLDQAEKQLARAEGATRLSSLPANAPRSGGTAPVTTRDTLPPVRRDSLPWRAPSGQSNPPPTAGQGQLSGPNLRPARGSLAALAVRENRVRLTAPGNAARLDAPLAFEEPTGNLTAESKRELDRIASLLRTEEGRGLQITVVSPGHVTKAQTVADYLDRHGIAQERLTVTAGESALPIAARGSAPVAILLSETEQPLRR